MLWRYRFVTDQWGYELLGGMVDAGEEAAATAAREAEEESGWRPAGEPEHLVSFEPLPGQVTAPVDVFLWRGAKRIGEPTNTEETGRVEWVPLSQVAELAQRQELLGSGTLVGLLYYLASRGGETIRGSCRSVGLGILWSSAARNARSGGVSRGLSTCRCRTASWWRSVRISMFLSALLIASNRKNLIIPVRAR
jgi:hypothetical protein